MAELPVFGETSLANVWKYAGEGKAAYIVDGNGFTVAGPMQDRLAMRLVNMHNHVVNHMINEHLTAVHNLK